MGRAVTYSPFSFWNIEIFIPYFSFFIWTPSSHEHQKCDRWHDWECRSGCLWKSDKTVEFFSCEFSPPTCVLAHSDACSWRCGRLLTLNARIFISYETWQSLLLWLTKTYLDRLDGTLKFFGFVVWIHLLKEHLESARRMCRWSFVISSGPITFLFFLFLTSLIKADGLKAFYWCKGAFANCSVLYVENVLRTEKSLRLNWDLHLAAVCEGLKKIDLVRLSSSSRFQPSSFFSASKGFLNCTFWPTQSAMSEKTGSQGCVSVGKLNLRQKKKALSHVKVTSNGKQYQSKHPPPPVSTPLSPALI